MGRLDDAHLAASRAGRGPATPTTVAEWNDVTGAGVDEAVIVEVLEDLRLQGWLIDLSPGLTATEIDYLGQHGGVTDDRGALLETRVAAAVRGVGVEREALTVAQAAAMMRISASRVRHRISDGTLYAYRSEGRGIGRAIPSWQFRDRSPIPHLADVLGSLPTRFRPVDIRAFALNAEIDDPLRSAAVPLLDWLHDGGDPEVARALAVAEDRLI